MMNDVDTLSSIRGDWMVNLLDDRITTRFLIHMNMKSSSQMDLRRSTKQISSQRTCLHKWTAKATNIYYSKRLPITNMITVLYLYLME